LIAATLFYGFFAILMWSNVTGENATGSPWVACRLHNYSYGVFLTFTNLLLLLLLVYCQFLTYTRGAFFLRYQPVSAIINKETVGPER
jgi:hypothetical protein